MKTKSRRSHFGSMTPRQLRQGSRRNQRRLEVFKVRPSSDEPVAGDGPSVVSGAPAADPSFMLVNDMSQLSDNYDLVESVACSLFDQIALPRR